MDVLMPFYMFWSVAPPAGGAAFGAVSISIPARFIWECEWCLYINFYNIMKELDSKVQYDTFVVDEGAAE